MNQVPSTKLLCQEKNSAQAFFKMQVLVLFYVHVFMLFFSARLAIHLLHFFILRLSFATFFFSLKKYWLSFNVTDKFSLRPLLHYEKFVTTFRKFLVQLTRVLDEIAFFGEVT